MSTLYKNDYIALFKSIKNKIVNSNSKKDLIPLIIKVFDLNELKNICLKKINEIKINENENENELSINNVRSVYLNIMSIDTILPNDLLVDIIKFEKSRDYPKYFYLSKDFNAIMNNNSTLFIDYLINVESFLWERHEYYRLNHKNKSISLFGKYSSSILFGNYPNNGLSFIF